MNEKRNKKLRLPLYRRLLPPVTAVQRSAAERAALCLFLAFITVGALAAGSVAATVPTFAPELGEAAALSAIPPCDTLAVCAEPPAAPGENTVIMSFVGDCMLASMLGSTAFGTFGALAETQPPEYFFSQLEALFLSDDWTVANCENVFTDDETLEPTFKNHSPAYWYRSKTANAEIFHAGGVDIVSVANNHAQDYGEQGYADTTAALEAHGVLWGDNSKTLTLEKSGVTVALLCTTLYYAGFEQTVNERIRAARSDGADYVIVYYHGGTERVYEPDTWRVTAAHSMIDAGADLVLGGHPHVLQPSETYNGKTIIHSLGNFLFGGSVRPENRTAVFRLTLTLGDGEVLAEESEIIPCYVWTDPWLPAVIADEAEAAAVKAFMSGEAATPFGD